MSEKQSADNDEVCDEHFYTYHSGWSVPRFCHRPEGHIGEHCGRGNGVDHLRRCTDAVPSPASDVTP